MSEVIDKHIAALGHTVTDKVTGFKGVVTCVSFELYGCVQAIVTPPVDEKGEDKAGKWFDVTRLENTGEEPVMGLPNFQEGYIAEGKKGGSDKPLV